MSQTSTPTTWSQTREFPVLMPNQWITYTLEHYREPIWERPFSKLVLPGIELESSTHSINCWATEIVTM